MIEGRYRLPGILTAPTDDDLRRDIELAQAIGFNGAGKHQKVEDPRWLYWADRSQSTDVEQEVNGLLTDERVPKVSLGRIREITTQTKT